MKDIILSDRVFSKGRFNAGGFYTGLEDVGIDHHICFNVTINSCYLQL